MTGICSSIKLTILQRLMRRWNQSVAYNAIHVVEMYGDSTADQARFEQATLDALQAIGWGYPVIRKQDEIDFLPIENLQLETAEDLDDYLNQALNKPFADDAHPFRFFFIPLDDKRYYFGVSYNHWVADAYAIRRLLQNIIDRVQGKTITEKLTLHAPAFTTLFSQHLGLFKNFLWFTEMFHNFKIFYRAYRPQLHHISDFYSQFVMQKIPANVLHNLKNYCHEHQIQLNDLFVAELALIMGKFTANLLPIKKSPRFGNRYDRVAISSIVDIRLFANQSLENVQGQYLGSYTVVIKDPEQRTIENILQDVHAQIIPIKNNSRLVRSHYSFEITLRVLDKIPHAQQQAMLLQSKSPICAGISNINVKEAWDSSEQYSPSVVDYWRISPTGPLAPCIFSITTFRKQLTVSLTYRPSALDKATAEMLCHAFCTALCGLGMHT